MAQTNSLGKLTHKDSGKELAFSLNPTAFRLNRAFDYEVEPRLGQPSSLISFRSGGLTQLSCDLIFDKDVDKDCDLPAVEAFTRALNKINTDTKSVSLVEFCMGQFRFSGYVLTFALQLLRFDTQGAATRAGLAIQLVSDGAYEES